MEIKYEAVFGSQELFDGSEPDVFLVETNGVYKTFHKETTGKVSIWTKSGCDLAMRRIIRTPTWTVADQKAGRLPEVGAELAHKTQGLCEFIGLSVDDKTCWALKLKSSLIYIAAKNWCSPIESQEEKAKRLEDEWVNKAWSETAVFAGVTQDEHDRLRIHLRHIYKAQLSGELQAPKGGE